MIDVVATVDFHELDIKVYVAIRWDSSLKCTRSIPRREHMGSNQQSPKLGAEST